MSRTNVNPSSYEDFISFGQSTHVLDEVTDDSVVEILDVGPLDALETQYT